MSTFYELERYVREEVRELASAAAENGGPFEPSDLIHELADGWTPIYTSELMSLAADNLRLATVEPELGPAFDGSPTPANIIAANVYEALTAAGWQEWEAIMKKHKAKRIQQLAACCKNYKGKNPAGGRKAVFSQSRDYKKHWSGVTKWGS